MFQLRITLNKIDPPIYRIITVPETVSLYKLHQIIQAAMGWKNYHLYYFGEWENKIGDPQLWEYDNTVWDKKIHLKDKLKTPGDTLSYVYDMGDNWEHTITLEAILPDTPENSITCIDASRACPPEDCGGVPGYLNILRVLDHFGSEEYHEMMAWLGTWHPENIVLGNINRRLKKFNPVEKNKN